MILHCKIFTVFQYHSHAINKPGLQLQMHKINKLDYKLQKIWQFLNTDDMMNNVYRKPTTTVCCGGGGHFCTFKLTEKQHNNCKKKKR